MSVLLTNYRGQRIHLIAPLIALRDCKGHMHPAYMSLSSGDLARLQMMMMSFIIFVLSARRARVEVRYTEYTHACTHKEDGIRGGRYRCSDPRNRGIPRGPPAPKILHTMYASSANAGPPPYAYKHTPAMSILLGSPHKSLSVVMGGGMPNKDCTIRERGSKQRCASVRNVKRKSVRQCTDSRLNKPTPTRQAQGEYSGQSYKTKHKTFFLHFQSIPESHCADDGCPRT